MRAKTWWIILLVALAILAISLFVVKRTNAEPQGSAGIGDECNVHAEDESHICSEGLTCVPQKDDSEGNGKCESNATATPTATPSATPTVEPTATATPSCEEDEDCPTVTPTPTPTPTETPAPTETPHEQGLTPAGAPDRSCVNITQTPIILSFTRVNPTAIKVIWTKTDPNNYIVYYGFSADKLEFNTTVENSTEVTIGNLPTGKMIWVQVATTDNVCVGNRSNLVDP